jgi:malate synthase
MTDQTVPALELRAGVEIAYDDVLIPAARAAMAELAPLDLRRRQLMAERIARRAARYGDRRPIGFLPADQVIGGTAIGVREAREGRFEGGEIPPDLVRQWIQGTGPAAKPDTSLARSIRNAAYALLSGADGWMFDGEDALGQVRTMSLDNQRNLKLAIHGDPLFLDVAEQVAAEMNRWSQGFFGRPIVEDWRRQLGFTTRIFRARGLHLDDRHVRRADGAGFSASIVDLCLYGQQPAKAPRAGILGGALPAEDPDRRGGGAVERHAGGARGHLGLEEGAIKAYVLVEQLEASFQLMEIRAALGRTSSASTPGAGTTSTASPTRWLGSGTSSTRTSTRSP